MAEDLPSREILKQLVKRLDLLERVLGRNTARLRNIEQHLGIAFQQQALHESLAQQNDETHAATSRPETPPATYEVETHRRGSKSETPDLKPRRQLTWSVAPQGAPRAKSGNTRDAATGPPRRIVDNDVFFANLRENRRSLGRQPCYR